MIAGARLEDSGSHLQKDIVRQGQPRSGSALRAAKYWPPSRRALRYLCRGSRFGRLGIARAHTTFTRRAIAPGWPQASMVAAGFPAYYLCREGPTACWRRLATGKVRQTIRRVSVWRRGTWRSRCQEHRPPANRKRGLVDRNAAAPSVGYKHAGCCGTCARWADQWRGAPQPGRARRDLRLPPIRCVAAAPRQGHLIRRTKGSELVAVCRWLVARPRRGLRSAFAGPAVFIGNHFPDPDQCRRLDGPKWCRCATFEGMVQGR